MRTNVAVWIAQGFGLGRIRLAPGTFGSVGGVGWCLFLLSLPNPYLFLAGTLLGVLISVKTSTIAEIQLATRDPGSVVIDEIAAIPVCFLGWLALTYGLDEQWPGIALMFQASAWPKVAAIFVLFRFFDVVKPWPVWQAQNLPGGWGITVDDLVAAVYVNLCIVCFISAGRFWDAQN